ncbi:MAG: hypothetical protein JNL35_12465 [Sphingopyxis sp.]|nr:hypothetical protein [Sphingopyxis sp.]
MAFPGEGVAPARAATALEVLRVTAALLIRVHCVHRLTMGLVAPFGTWLDSLGFPMAMAGRWR